MLASVLFVATVVSSLGFMAWLAFFVLNRGLNTNLETAAESRRIFRRYLAFGTVLLVASIGFGVWFYQIEEPLSPPELGPGLPLKLIEERKAAMAEAEAAREALEQASSLGVVEK